LAEKKKNAIVVPNPFCNEKVNQEEKSGQITESRTMLCKEFKDRSRLPRLKSKDKN
jgi:hypothetical protein